MGIPELPLNRLAILQYLEERYFRKFVLFTKPGTSKGYAGVVNRINVEIDAAEVGDCSLTIQIGETRVETSVLTFIYNTGKYGDLQPGTANNG